MEKHVNPSNTMKMMRQGEPVSAGGAGPAEPTAGVGGPRRQHHAAAPAGACAVAHPLHDARHTLCRRLVCARRCAAASPWQWRSFHGRGGACNRQSASLYRHEPAAHVGASAPEMVWTLPIPDRCRPCSAWRYHQKEEGSHSGLTSFCCRRQCRGGPAQHRLARLQHGGAAAGLAGRLWHAAAAVRQPRPPDARGRRAVRHARGTAHRWRRRPAARAAVGDTPSLCLALPGSGGPPAPGNQLKLPAELLSDTRCPEAPAHHCPMSADRSVHWCTANEQDL